ncbi:MAG: hypothetical protein Q4G42_01775 [Neisseria sp.]|nr:hypothetical protein [Neisseria sp.]
MREVTWVLPGADLPQEYLTFERALPQWDVPTLNLWRRFARRRSETRQGGDLLAHTFVGSLKAKLRQALDLAADTPCFLAAPVSQHMDLHSMQVTAGDELRLSWTEAHRAANALNEFLQENGWECHVYRPDLWLMTYPQNLDWHAPDVWSLHGRADADSKITGADAAQMLQRLTETQMLLFAHAQHAPRADASLPAVNGLWWWQDSVGCAAADAAVVADITWLPESDRLLQTEQFNWQDIKQFAADHDRVTVYAEGASRALQRLDMAAHTAFLQRFDRECLQAAWQDMLAGSLQTCRVISERSVLTMNAARRWQWWRRERPYRGSV